uniref:Histone-lysine N-methyltransferase SETMAR n=1 Tax=Bursaphelenchus xylophilus TaxID=6326 RepID=A0A1I7SHQ9_BURXY
MGWEVLDHPPYSPDISPTDFHLFRGLEHWIRGKKIRFLKEFFASKARAWYARGINLLEERWQKLIESGGEYFE